MDLLEQLVSTRLTDGAGTLAKAMQASGLQPVFADNGGLPTMQCPAKCVVNTEVSVVIVGDLQPYDAATSEVSQVAASSAVDTVAACDAVGNSTDDSAIASTEAETVEEPAPKGKKKRRRKKRSSE